ncbi:sugar transferase [Photobacterium lutimaris]|uniref:LPS biosynthesis sugar transferase SypR n=1 Tax=Photobacterium lutimaris TaxID=388278 RepID=A0A2T3IX81_9GAMM|nr:sugar transferase [Photobacterium lutimaris]PSU33104.1 LPS biosynthesis sugar transferase SypR [Photobacterium lutimaris]TDR70194.1 lipopolysaccharide/colanic/teichoic acid biosynthesis glycosyltransferase [Photobacterium lutimaris]
MTISWMVLITMTIVIVYHHVIYTGLMIFLGRKEPVKKKGSHRTTEPPLSAGSTELPSVAILIPAHNEADFIEAKLANLLMLNYPPEKLSVWICCDGCSDNTAERALGFKDKYAEAGIQLECIVETNNKGKVVRINQLLSLIKDKVDLIAMSDVSALLSIDALTQAAESFTDPKIGAQTCNYLLAEATRGEEQYWQWQNSIRQTESKLGSVMGGNGAFYIVRAPLFSSLPEDTINDDFIQTMLVIKQGYQVQFNHYINSVELSPSSEQDTYQRRQRIGAGNLQQLIRCRFVFRHNHHGARWLFTSGKALRTLMPFILIGYFLLSLALAIQGSALAQLLTALQATGYLAATLPRFGLHSKLTDKLHYFVSGYAASLIGMLRYFMGHFRSGWRHLPPLSSYQAQSTQLLKRTSDILLATTGMVLTLPLWPLIALLIKLDSPGPVFYRQMRVGRISEEQVELFDVIKFRSMSHNAESKSGATWAQQNDPRITRIGHFLRVTRLDELPQFINVIKGEMALIGPRPERPEFCGTLQNALPFYLERTAGLKPGITGLAQVSQGYDSDLEDVKNKIGFDHAYALALSSPLQWIKMDLFIIFKTIYIMVSKRGQ